MTTETKTTHTPGPWKADLIGNTPSHILTHDGKHIAAYVFGTENGITEAEANARLIAAAPELLAACERMLWWWQDMQGDVCTCDETDTPCDGCTLRAAIAKATGN